MSGRGDDAFWRDEKVKPTLEVPTGPVWLRPGGQHEPALRDITGSFTMQDGTIVMKCDPVDRPAHYQHFGVEVIDIIRSVLGPEGFRAYCIGNELKYRLRAGDKGDAAQDLAKAMKYREFRETK